MMTNGSQEELAARVRIFWELSNLCRSSTTFVAFYYDDLLFLLDHLAGDDDTLAMKCEELIEFIHDTFDEIGVDDVSI
jgi:hypothetical protein